MKNKNKIKITLNGKVIKLDLHFNVKNLIKKLNNIENIY